MNRANDENGENLTLFRCGTSPNKLRKRENHEYGNLNYIIAIKIPVVFDD
jgi:hypothetical protein